MSRPTAPPPARTGAVADTRIQILDQQLQETQQVLRQTVDDVGRRGERLDAMQEKSDQLKGASNKFVKRTNVVKRAMWFKNVKWTIAIVVVVILILLAIIIPVVVNSQKS